LDGSVVPSLEDDCYDQLLTQKETKEKIKWSRETVPRRKTVVYDS
jgi:hypothetical protein